MSTDHPPIVQALAAAAADMPVVGKDGRNKEQGYNFRSADDVVTAAHHALCRHGVVIVPKVRSRTETDYHVRSGSRWAKVVVEVDYQVCGPAGDTLDASMIAEAVDMSDKATNKALTFAFKYLLNQLLTVPFADVDPDADSPPEQVAPDPANTEPADWVSPAVEQWIDQLGAMADTHPVWVSACREKWKQITGGKRTPTTPEAQDRLLDWLDHLDIPDRDVEDLGRPFDDDGEG